MSESTGRQRLLANPVVRIAAVTYLLLAAGFTAAVAGVLLLPETNRVARGVLLAGFGVFCTGLLYMTMKYAEYAGLVDF